MKRVVCLLLSLILLLGLLPTALAADGEGTGEKLEYGEPVGFTVEIKGEKRICFMGVGQLINGKYDLLSGTTMGWSQHQPGSLHVAVGLWWLKDFGGGNYDWIALTSDEVDAVTEQVGPFSLEIIPDSGQRTTPDAQNETDASAPKMPCQRYYELVKGHRGDWILKASCTVKDKTLTAYGAATLTVMEDISLTNEQCKSVEAINAALEEKIEELQEKNAKAEADMYTITAYLTDTDQDAYRGQIRIEDWRVDGVELWVQIMGVGQNQGVEKIPVTLSGGIYSDTIPFSVSGVNFVGAGKGKTNWPKDGPNKGNANVAFDGNSMSNVSKCTFTGYDIAIKCGTSLRMFGRYNTFTENHIAWKLSEECEGDGNPDAQSCVFKENDYALYVEKFNGFPSRYAPRYCRFIDNTFDVYNGSGRWWFLPGNFFSHNGILMPVYDRISAGATSVFCYPMATREGTNGQEENNPVTYYYDQLDKDGDTVSNAQTSAYQTPAGKLDGKTFKVADTEKDNILATFSFDDTAAEQAEEEPVRRVLRARMLRSAVEPSFDATVTVDRSDASKIVFHMEDPCKRVTVSLPCEFKDGTVKLKETGAEIPAPEFDGQTVSFQTDKAGTYVIESKTPVQPKPDDAITGIISGIVASGALQPGASASQFADLTSGSWYYGGVRYALENGLMTGTSARTFAPNRPVTRAMLVTILWRLAGEPYGRVSPFEDVLPGSWYAQAVSWAYDKGIVTGVTATSFQPGAPVTREQLCAILCRYAALTGKNTAASAPLDAFTDRAQVSAYAEASVRWALQAGLLTGVGDGRLAPRSGARRAQLAVLLQRFAGLK